MPGIWSGGTWLSHGKRTVMDAPHASGGSHRRPNPLLLAKSGLKYSNEVGIGGLGVGSDPRDAVGRLLAGYYDRVNYAIGFSSSSIGSLSGRPSATGYSGCGASGAGGRACPAASDLCDFEEHSLRRAEANR